MGILASGVVYLIYQKEVASLQKDIFSQMRVCSYTLKCKEFIIDFADKKDKEPYKLYHNTQEISGYFPIPTSKQYFMKLSMPQEEYKKLKGALVGEAIVHLLFALVWIGVLSMLFSWYALRPLRQSLVLTQEFIKDILHDFNTPLSTLRLNVSMLSGDQKSKVTRIQNSLDHILALQENLRAYLYDHQLQKDHFYLKEFLSQRVAMIDKLYPDITFEIRMEYDVQLYCNKEALSRIIDNIATNAAKYNKKYGKVIFEMQKTQLSICDTGKGIQNPSKIFERFYKEQERGIGIGLHIVKKLCDALEIEIKVKSSIDKGSCFYLELKNLL